MTYWRMQVHPASPGDAVAHTIESLAAGYIGLDFAIPRLAICSKLSRRIFLQIRKTIGPSLTKCAKAT